MKVLSVELWGKLKSRRDGSTERAVGLGIQSRVECRNRERFYEVPLKGGRGWLTEFGLSKWIAWLNESASSFTADDTMNDDDILRTLDDCSLLFSHFSTLP